MFLNKYKYYFFDFDGVIADSVDIKTKAFARLFEGYGNEIVKQVVEYHLNNKGVSRYDKFRYYYQVLLKKEISEEDIKALGKQFSEIVYEEVIKAPFIEGVIDFLELCLQRQKTMFIISATPQNEIKRIIQDRGISHYFREVLGSPATKEENLGILIDTYNIDPSEAVYFGDAQKDFEAAQMHGVSFVPINYSDGRPTFKNFISFMKEMEIRWR